MSRYLDPGKLRHRVTLQALETTVDDYGMESSGWVDHATVWADVHPVSAREFIAGGQVNSKVTTRITIRYRDDVEPTMRAVSRGKVYQIEGVLPDPDSGLEYLTLPCSTGANDGQ